MPKIFEVQYSFKCPEAACLKQNANTITITGDDVVGVRELATADLSCEQCRAKLPEGYFVYSAVREAR